MKTDLVVVVADGGIEQAIRGLLTRHKAIGIRALNGVEFPKEHKLDQGVYASGHELAALYHSTHEHAIVILDFDWAGRPTEDPAEMARHVENNLRATWGDKGRCIVIVPELENWLWSDSPHVARALGWNSLPELRQWLESLGLWQHADAKPGNPKDAYLRAIRQKRVQQTNATFYELAKQVSLQRCSDAAFLSLLEILRRWFPEE